MQRKSKILVSGGFLLGLLLLLAVSLTATSIVLAQEPTPTPTDPVWRGFSAARDAIEAERGIDLTLVQQYTFEQAEFVNGIDTGCVTLEEGVFSRRVWFGWVFNITSLRGEVHQARVSFDLQDVAVCEEVVTAAAPAADAGNDTDLPAPVVAGSAANGSFELGGHVLDLNGNTVSLLNRSGMTWVKKQLQFNLGDDPSKAQGLINQANANGFKVLIGIVGNKSQMGDFSSYIASYSDFVGGVAALGAHGIEVWNEPNIDREWPAGSINGAELYTVTRSSLQRHQISQCQYHRDEWRTGSNRIFRRGRVWFGRMQR